MAVICDLSSDNEDDDREALPAFQRSQQISDIFTGVNSILPDMEFSDADADSENETVGYILVHRY